MYLEWGKLVVEFLRAAVWPAAIVWLAYYYREDIKGLAQRLLEVGPMKAVLAPPQQSVQQVSPEPALSVVEGSASLDYAKIIANIGASVPADLLNIAEDQIRTAMPASVKANPTEFTNVLMGIAASMYVQLQHERTYRVIYGSQLRAMVEMNSPAGIDATRLKEIYGEAAVNFPSLYPAVTFELWSDFLVRSGLVHVETGRYELTAAGRGFLRYIIESRLPPNKPF